MTVLHIARHEWPNDVRRNPLDLKNLEALAERLGEQHMIVQSRDGRAFVWRAGAVTVELLRPRGRSGLRSLFFLGAATRSAWRVITTRRVDVINASDLWGAIVGCVLRRRFGVGLAVQLQNDFFDPPAAAFGSPLKRRAMREVARFVCEHADAIRCLSEGIRDKAIAAGVPPERLTVVGSRVDPALFARARWAEEGIALREELRAGDLPVVMYVGSLTPRKGVETLVDAGIALAERGVRAKIVLVGDGDLAPQLRRRTAGVPGRFEFAGRVQHDLLPAYLASADVFAFPSLSEGMPRAVLEAMAMGCAVVATDIEGVRDIVQHEQTGLLVRASDPDALADALQRLVGDPSLAQALGESAARVATHVHGFDRNMDELAGLFRSAASRRRPTAR
jgi:glycosyltransferase involved in cell wall biosynthesis